jgi:hypothetical protein
MGFAECHPTSRQASYSTPEISRTYQKQGQASSQKVRPEQLEKAGVQPEKNAYILKDRKM